MRNIRLPEDTFLRVCTREHGPAPTEKLCIDTRDFNHFSETYLANELNDSRSSNEIVVLD